MFGTYFFVFFEGEGKEGVAWEFKEFIEALLGEEAGVGRALERPWVDPSTVERRRAAPGLGDDAPQGPWSYARCVFEFPTYEERFRDESLGGEGFRDRSSDEGEGPFGGGEIGEEDSTLYLFGSDMPPEWRESPVTLSFPPFALPAGIPEERRASRPKAKKILRWLTRQQRRRRVEIHLSAGYFGTSYFEPRELSAARLLTMARELEEGSEPELPPYAAALDLELDLGDPENCWEEPKDSPHWPARIWRRLIS